MQANWAGEVTGQILRADVNIFHRDICGMNADFCTAVALHLPRYPGHPDDKTALPHV